MGTKGFTLVEILVVVLVLAILTGIAYPMYTKSVRKARATELMSVMTMIKKKQQLQHIRTGSYFTKFSDMGRITNNMMTETLSEGDSATIEEYTIVLNTANNCMRGNYEEGTSKGFVIAMNYENRNIGCDGSICNVFEHSSSADAICTASEE